ncbi:hypothetical protein I8751_11680 [Nostocaceae cyanobacterium CENA357]|uniref:Uncharacterized protein n=1 Tax=Atlanticothrix silvestris CENA357 TaxID=1725252 RepID=A0A8J7L288_9CYAN|nr:hypothetical protein [Atlanticothrix silvestris]MBH8553014.1 hypothetical protein [Atlanticothrix silvestris CENA357]
MIKAIEMDDYSTSLQDILSAEQAKHDVTYTTIRCMFDCLKLADSINHLGKKNPCSQYLILLIMNKIYNLNAMNVAVNVKKTSTASCQSNSQSQSLTGLLGEPWVYQRYCHAKLAQ